MDPLIPRPISEPLRHLLQPPYLYLALLTLVILLLFALLARYRRLHKGIVPFQSQDGSIEIAPQTLRGVMQHAVISIEGVEKAVCRPLPHGNSLGVRVSIHLRANCRLRAIENQIQQQLRATLADQFGMESVEPIHIRVTKVIGDPLTRISETPAGQRVPTSETDPIETNQSSEDSPPEKDECSQDQPSAGDSRDNRI